MNKLSAQNRNVILNIIGAFVIKGGSLVISVILLPMYLRFFHEQEILGIWYTILSVLNWVILFDLGLGQGLRNQLPKALNAKDKKMAKEYISTTYILMTAVAVIILLLGIVVLRKIDLYAIFNVNETILNYSDLEKSVIIVFIGIIVQIVLKIVTSILYAIQKSAMVNLLSLLTNMIILISLCIIPSKDTASNLITMSWINVAAANIPYIICTCWIFFGKELKGTGPSIKFFSRRYVSVIFNVGIALMWLQVVFMIVSSANEFLISNFTSPRYVVEYQAYYKIFKTAAMVVSLALTPIWSAVTKAQIEQNYNWIKKIYFIFLGLSGFCFIGEICMIPFLQWGMNIWLGAGVIEVKVMYALVFAASSVIFVLHSVNTSIGNGLSYFKLQMILMTFAAVIFVPLSWILVKISNCWIGVVLASVIAMLPYEMIAPILTLRKLSVMEKQSKK